MDTCAYIRPLLLRSDSNLFEPSVGVFCAYPSYLFVYFANEKLGDIDI